MAQYKVPQDVEADDKLLGPFTFRQFVYLMIMGGCIALAVALFQLFPFLAILPLPFAIFFAVLALPLKKDQPMETYLAAIVSFHLKPRNRFWNPGQRESTIQITAPKIIEQPRARNITGEEASTRLSFLANIVDTEGNSLRSSVASPMQPEFRAEASTAPDMLDYTPPDPSTQLMANNQNSQRAAIINQMRATFAAQEQAKNQPATPIIPAIPGQASQNQTPQSPAQQNQTPQTQQPQIPPTPVQPVIPTLPENPTNPENPATPEPTAPPAPEPPEPEVHLPTPEELAKIEPLDSPAVITPDIAAMRRAAENKARLAALARDKDLTVATIAKEADRIEKKSKIDQDQEVYISLH